MSQKITKINYSRKGFSLVELMIVVGIIGILASMTTASFRAMSVKARQTEARTQLKMAFTLSEVYLQQNGSYPAAPFLMVTEGTGVCGDVNYCNIVNDFGFSIVGCAKRYYNYDFVNVAANQFVIVAAEVNASGNPDPCRNNSERTVYVGCTAPQYDQYQIDDKNLFKRKGVNPAKFCN